MTRLVSDSIQPIDLTRALATGYQIRASRQAAEQNDWQFQRAKEEHERQQKFRDAWASGDMDGARSIAPDLYQKVTQQGLETQKSMTDIANTRSQLFERERKAKNETTSEFQKRVANLMVTNPEQAGRWQSIMEQRAGAGEINAFDVPGQHLLPGGVEGPQVLPNRQEARAMQQQAGVDPYAGMANDVKDYLQRYPDDSPDAPGFGARVDAWDRQNRRSSATTVNVGGNGVGASAKTRTEQEGALLKANDTAAMLDELERIATTPDGKVNFGQFLGLVPRGKRATLDVVASIDPGLVPEDQRQWFDRASEFRAAIGEYKSREYHDMLGGSQTASEIRNLVDVVLSADMSDPAFNAAYKQLRRKTARAQAVSSMVLAEKIPVGTPEYRKRFSEIERERFGGGGGPQADVRPETVDLWNKTP